MKENNSTTDVDESADKQVDDTDHEVGEPAWDETPVTINVVQDILEAHPDYTLTSHVGPDGHRYLMVQFFDEEPNHQANSDFVSFVSELTVRDVDTDT